MTMNPHSNIIEQKVVGELLQDQLNECYGDSESIFKIVIEIEDKEPNGLDLDSLLPEASFSMRFNIAAANSFQSKHALAQAKESLSKLGIHTIRLDAFLDSFGKRLASSRQKLELRKTGLCLIADVSLNQAIQIIELAEVRAIQLFA